MRRAVFFAIFSASSLASCGSGTAAIIEAIGGGGGGGSSPTVVGDLTVGVDALDLKVSPVQVSFRLTDQDSTPTGVQLSYTLPGGGAPVALALVGAPSLGKLATSPAGVVHAFQWDFEAQLPAGPALSQGVQVAVRTASQKSSATSAPLALGNDAPEVAIVSAPAGELSELVPVDLLVSDSSSDLVALLVEYRDLDAAAGWLPATLSGAAPTNLPATPSGYGLTVYWDSQADVPGQDLTAELRFTPDDGTHTGAAVRTPELSVDNDSAPTVFVNGAAFLVDPDQRRGIPVPFRIVDEEGGPVELVFQWSRPLEPFPPLPDDPAELAALLDDPAQRILHRIASEHPVARGGTCVPVDADRVRLPEVGLTGLPAGSLAGKELRIHRSHRELRSVVAGWTANPLLRPRAVAALGDGTRLLVLDAPSAGSWRMREIEAATGAVLDTLAAGSEGEPTCVALEEAGGAVLVACDSAGAWSLLRLDLASGALTPLVLGSGSPPGPVRGLVSRTEAVVFLTAGSELVQVDYSDPLSPVQTTAVTGLEAPWGVALGSDARRLYLSERDWIDPGTSQVEGRVLIVDLESGSTGALAPTGASLSRPEALAFDPAAQMLLAVTDASPADGTRELRAVEIGGSAVGASFELDAGLPDATMSLATGPFGLRVVASAESNDLAIGGGVQQVRTIAAFDPAALEATVSPPFDPAPAALQPWSIDHGSGSLTGSPEGTDGSFVWDSADLPTGGEVVLRATPYDSEQGSASDTGVPKEVRSGLDVQPFFLGGPGLTTGVSAAVAADLDGDGLLDLAAASTGEDAVTVHHQSADGSFPVVPDLTIQGGLLSPMDGPAALQAADLDADGDLDLVVANGGGGDLTVVRQLLPGTFTADLLNLGAGSQPSAVVVADLSGDGRLDIAVANRGSNTVGIYRQSVGGLFPLSPSLVVGGATTLQPAGLAAGDLDGDGDLDLLTANRQNHTLSLFFQGAGGTFAAAPSAVLAAGGLMSVPTGVVIGDLDGDAPRELASANEGSDNLTVFDQAGGGAFGPLPAHALSSIYGPIQPRALCAADVDGDADLDLLCTSAGDELEAFLFDQPSGAFLADPLVLAEDGSLSGPEHVLASDLNGDGRVDAVVSNTGGDTLAVFVQEGPPGFEPTPDLWLGGPQLTPDPSALALADLDGDGDLDLATANASSATLTILAQLGPATFASTPAAVLGPAPELAGASCVATADLNGDGRVDLVAAGASSGSLALFFQTSGGSFAALPDAVAGGLGSPASVLPADLDGDGDLDLVSANRTGNDLALFLQQAPGVFPGAPDALLGSAASTAGPRCVVAADLDGDGDQDLACANAAGNTLAVFEQGPGGFAAAPDHVLGGAGVSGAPRSLAAFDADGDGDLDLLSANEGTDDLTLFLQEPTGTFPAMPAATLDASVSDPVSLALLDVDLDGFQDAVCANRGSDTIAYFPGNPDGFAAVPKLLGGPLETGDPERVLLLDVDGDGDADVVGLHPALDSASVFFGSH